MTSPGAHCWRHIGVHGDRSCPELVAHVHCRNCVWFARGARELFARQNQEPVEELPVEPPSRGATQSGSVLVFRLGQDWYALSSMIVREIGEARPVRRIAHRVGRLLEGLVNVRGELQLCVALDRLLGSVRQGANGEQRRSALLPTAVQRSVGAPAPVSDRALASNPTAKPTRLILAEVDEQGFCFFADEVRGIERLADLVVESPPAAAPPALQQVVRQLLRLPGGQAALLLEPEPLYRRIRQEAF